MRAGHRVLVTVGTDHHRFDRLTRWADRWASTRTEVEVVAQHGPANPIEHGTALPMLAYEDLAHEMARADVVVCHGGPATIMEARALGRRPVVVARRAFLHEAVDDHQVAFGRWMADRRLVWLAEDEGAFGRLLDELLTDPTATHVGSDDRTVAAGAVDAFRSVVDPLTARRAGRRHWRARKPAGPG